MTKVQRARARARSATTEELVDEVARAAAYKAASSARSADPTRLASRIAELAFGEPQPTPPTGEDLRAMAMSFFYLFSQMEDVLGPDVADLGHQADFLGQRLEALENQLRGSAPQPELDQVELYAETLHYSLCRQERHEDELEEEERTLLHTTRDFQQALVQGANKRRQLEAAGVEG